MHAIGSDDRGLVKSSTDEILRFIVSSFRSVWALELLLLLKGDPRPWSHGDLNSTMRASEVVVVKALAGLEAAGLVTIADGRAQYTPVNEEVAALVEQAEALYAKRPDTVRRAIISVASGDAAAFANAFRLRKE